MATIDRIRFLLLAALATAACDTASSDAGPSANNQDEGGAVFDRLWGAWRTDKPGVPLQWLELDRGAKADSGTAAGVRRTFNSFDFAAFRDEPVVIETPNDGTTGRLRIGTDDPVAYELDGDALQLIWNGETATYHRAAASGESCADRPCVSRGLECADDVCRGIASCTDVAGECMAPTKVQCDFLGRELTDHLAELDDSCPEASTWCCVAP